MTREHQEFVNDIVSAISEEAGKDKTEISSLHGSIDIDALSRLYSSSSDSLSVIFQYEDGDDSYTVEVYRGEDGEGVIEVDGSEYTLGG